MGSSSTHLGPPRSPSLRLVGPDEIGASRAVAEYVALSDRLKHLRGVDFETHDHPAVVLDRATSPATRVWGWWADAEPRLPCLMWASERGWSITVVEPGALDSEGYERALWSHRIHLLDLALANAMGPFTTLEELEVAVSTESSFGLGSWGTDVRSAVLWGVAQLRTARAPRRRSEPNRPAAVRPAHASVDEELARCGLVPTLAKGRGTVDPVQEAGLEALLRAVARAGQRSEGHDEHDRATHA